MRYLLLIFALTLILSGVSSAAVMEERCTELGSNCKCSEPLGSSLAYNPNESHANPNDSTGGGAKECGNNGNALDASGGSITFRWQQDTPDGPWPGGITSVVKSQSTNHHALGVVPSSSSRRMCTRYYATESSDFVHKGDGDTCVSCKYAQFAWPHGGPGKPQFHFVGQGWGETQVTLKGGNGWSVSGAAPTGVSFSPTYMSANCRGALCRFEMCAYGTNVRNGQGLFMVARVHVLTGDHAGDVYIASREAGNAVNAGPMSNAEDIWIANHHHGENDCATGNGYRQVSHVMQAEWDSPGNASGPFIGEAYEIESGEPGPTPTPTAPPPTPTPTATPTAEPPGIPVPNETEGVDFGSGATIN